MGVGLLLGWSVGFFSKAFEERIYSIFLSDFNETLLLMIMYMYI